MKFFQPAIDVRVGITTYFACKNFHYSSLQPRMSINRSKKRDVAYRNLWTRHPNVLYWHECGLCKLRSRCEVYSLKHAAFRKNNPIICGVCAADNIHFLAKYILWKLKDYMNFSDIKCCRCAILNIKS